MALSSYRKGLHNKYRLSVTYSKQLPIVFAL